MRCFFGICLIITVILNVQADSSVEVEESDGPKKLEEPSIGDSILKGAGNWFKDVSEKSQDKREEFSEEAKEKWESGVGVMKSFAGGIGERFSKAKEKLEESGEKIKEVVGHAALNTKEELETAGSKISKYAKDASETMMSMFG